jgi:hypothetical protein
MIIDINIWNFTLKVALFRNFGVNHAEDVTGRENRLCGVLEHGAPLRAMPLEYGYKDENAGGVACPVEPFFEKSGNDGLPYFGFDFLDGDETAFEPQGAFDHFTR